jgi:hypothetical protein
LSDSYWPIADTRLNPGRKTTIATSDNPPTQNEQEKFMLCGTGRINSSCPPVVEHLMQLGVIPQTLNNVQNT